MKKLDRARLSKVTKTASKLIGIPVMDFQSLFEAKAVKQPTPILEDPFHPLHDTLMANCSV